MSLASWRNPGKWHSSSIFSNCVGRSLTWEENSDFNHILVVLFGEKHRTACSYRRESMTDVSWFKLKLVSLNRHLPFPWSRRQIVSGRLQFPLDSWPTPWTCHSCPCTKPWTSLVTSRLCVVHTLPEAIPTKRRRSLRWCVYQRQLVKRILLLQRSLYTWELES